MNAGRRTIAGLFVSLVLGSAQGATPRSYFPDKGLGLFLSQRFDLATVRSSLGPRRTPAQRTFADMGMTPSEVTDKGLVFLSPGDWHYELRVVARGDFNGDGIEDLKACFTDRALNGGTYDAAEGLLLTRYSDNGYVIALNFRLEDGVCPTVSK